MSASAVQSGSTRPGSRGAGAEAGFALLVRLCGLLVLVLLGAIILMLFVGGLPAFRHFGLAFLVSTDWDPVQMIYGAAVPVFGTITTGVVALVIAVPLAFGVAYTLTELAPACAGRSASPSSCSPPSPRSSMACGASSSSCRSWARWSSRG